MKDKSRPMSLHDLFNLLIRSVDSYTPEQKKSLVDALARGKKRPKPEPEKWRN
jgi:hypothetical protein